MVPMSVKVVVVGRLAKKTLITPEKGERFYSLLVAVDRAKLVMRPDGKTMEADFYKCTTNVDCKSLVPGDYVHVEGRMVVKYWTEPKDAPRPTTDYRQDYEVRAETVSLIEDDTKKEVVKASAPSVGHIVSSSLG